MTGLELRLAGDQDEDVYPRSVEYVHMRTQEYAEKCQLPEIGLEDKKCQLSIKVLENKKCQLPKKGLEVNK